MIERWRGWAKGLKRESLSLYLAMRDPRTPRYAKLAAACIVAYALSPIDLIPDPIPVLGYLDDLVIVPLGILVVRRLIPKIVLDEARAQVEAENVTRPNIGIVGAGFIVALWVATVVLLVWVTMRWWRR